MSYSRRYQLYARSKGMSPEDLDREERSRSHKMEFVLWSDDMIWQWCQEKEIPRYSPKAIMAYNNINDWIEEKLNAIPR